MTESVLLIHGLWLNRAMMKPLAWRLEQAGLHCRLFGYASMMATPDENTARLAQTIATFSTQAPLHLVGHSMGGLLIRQLLHERPLPQPGRVVTLGTPHQGSHVARCLAASPLRPILGKGAGLLCEGPPPWRGERDLGSVAGTRPLGAGLLVGGLARPHDGTVAVAETRLDGARDHITVPASHLGILLSREAAAQTLCFLRNGHFDPAMSSGARPT